MYSTQVHIDNEQRDKYSAQVHSDNELRDIYIVPSDNKQKNMYNTQVALLPKQNTVIMNRGTSIVPRYTVIMN